MYEDFKVIDRWTGEDLHCVWKGTMVAIATRHATRARGREVT